LKENGTLPGSVSSPTVSVLMTAYNREKYIAEAIESVLASSFRDFELIIVDDGSKDRTVEIARRYMPDPRVQVHINEKNLGDYRNRNQAASYAQGKYLKYVDSDDLLYPHGLLVMVESMERFPEAAFGLCRPHSNKVPYPMRLSPKEAYERHFFDGGLFSNGPLSAIIRRDRFEEIGGFSGRRYVGDTELWLKLAQKFPVVLMTMGLTWWRSHGEQEIRSEITSNAAIDVRFWLAFEALTDENCPLGDEKRAAALKSLRIGHLHQLLLLFRHGHRREAWRLFRSARLNPGLVFPALSRILVRTK
jgi:hypothetical protein